MKNVIAIAMTSLLLAGCATPNYQAISPDEYASKISVQESEFNDLKLFSAMPIKGKAPSGHGYTAQMIAVQNKKTSSIHHALVMTWNYRDGNWAFFNSATLPGAVKLDLKENQKQVDNCSSYGVCTYLERVTALIPADALVSAPSSLKIQFGSSRGSTVIELPANYIQGYVQGVSKYTAGAL